MDTLGGEKIFKKETILQQKGNCVAVSDTLCSEVSSPQSAAVVITICSVSVCWNEPALCKCNMYK